MYGKPHYSFLKMTHIKISLQQPSVPYTTIYEGCSKGSDMIKYESGLHILLRWSMCSYGTTQQHNRHYKEVTLLEWLKI